MVSFCSLAHKNRIFFIIYLITCKVGKIQYVGQRKHSQTAFRETWKTLDTAETGPRLLLLPKHRALPMWEYILTNHNTVSMMSKYRYLSSCMQGRTPPRPRWSEMITKPTGCTSSKVWYHLALMPQTAQIIPEAVQTDPVRVPQMGQQPSLKWHFLHKHSATDHFILSVYKIFF